MAEAAIRRDAGCGPPGTPALPDYVSSASSTIVANAAEVSICNLRATLFVSVQGGVVFTVAGISNEVSVMVRRPEGPINVELGALVAGAAVPGVYRSADSGQCGGVALAFYLPAPPDTDCDGGTPPKCPANCQALCSAMSCGPCEPVGPEIEYVARASSDCIANTQPTGGSWTLALDSVVPYGGTSTPRGLTYYSVHGSFVAQLPGLREPTDVATVSVIF